MSRVFCAIGVATLVVGLQLLLAAGPVQAETVTITSDDFTFGIGATSAVAPIWSTTENDSNNSPTTQGDFTFSPSAISGGIWSTGGCAFANRTLTDSGVDISAYPADPAGFSVPIVASYTGAVPGDADPTNPNYQLTLEITGLGIYIGTYSSGTDGGVAHWTETTAGHSQDSPVTAISQGGNATIAANYTQMLWDPADYSVTLAGLGSSVTRSFTIPGEGPAPVTDYRYMDGIEVFGRVSLSYNAVPEPSTFLMLCVGCVGLLACNWRKRK